MKELPEEGWLVEVTLPQMNIVGWKQLMDYLNHRKRSRNEYNYTGGNVSGYYGVDKQGFRQCPTKSPGAYPVITLGEFLEATKHVSNKQKTEFMNTVKKSELVKLYNYFDCNEFKTRVKHYLVAHFDKTDDFQVTISKADIDTLNARGTSDQKAAVKALGFKLDNNAFLERVEDTELPLKEFSLKAFGDPYYLKTYNKLSRPDLHFKALYVNDRMKPIIEVVDGDTIIRFEKV